MYKFLNRWSRKLHRWGAVGFAIPLILVIITGLLLQIKKQWTWVQPPTQKGSFSESKTLSDANVAVNEILKVAMTDPLAEISGWKEVDRLDVRPSKGMVKVQSINGYEVQIDLATMEIMQSKYRRSDWIEQLHDGSFFGDWAKLSVFLVNGLVLLALWVSGAYLWYLPFLAKSKSKKRKKVMSKADDKSE